MRFGSANDVTMEYWRCGSGFLSGVVLERCTVLMMEALGSFMACYVTHASVFRYHFIARKDV
jgi:hypothetical protein